MSFILSLLGHSPLIIESLLQFLGQGASEQG